MNRQQDQQQCWEQADRSFPFFRISRVFAAREYQQRLLALYGLLGALERIHCEIREPEIALRKLQWWYAECLEKSPEESAHPVLREWVRSGAHQTCGRAQLSELFRASTQRLEADPVPDEEGLVSLCEMVSRPIWQLEASVCEFDHERIQVPESWFQSVGLYLLMRESLGNSTNTFWWVPMNLQARHSVSKQELSRIEGDQRTILAINEAMTSILHGMDEHAVGGHAGALEALSRRALVRISNARPEQWPDLLSQWKMMDFVTAWNSARVKRRG